MANEAEAEEAAKRTEQQRGADDLTGQDDVLQENVDPEDDTKFGALSLKRVTLGLRKFVLNLRKVA